MHTGNDHCFCLKFLLFFYQALGEMMILTPTYNQRNGWSVLLNTRLLAATLCRKVDFNTFPTYCCQETLHLQTHIVVMSTVASAHLVSHQNSSVNKLPDLGVFALN